MKVAILIISLYNLVWTLNYSGSPPVVVGTYSSQKECLIASYDLAAQDSFFGRLFCVYTEYHP